MECPVALAEARRAYPPSLGGAQNPSHLDFPRICKDSDAPMAAIIHPLLILRASLTRQELARQVTYLKSKSRILRSKFPKRMELSNQARRRLVKHGKSLGTRIKELISIVIHLGARRIWGSPCTANPTGRWTTQQVRNFDMFLQEEDPPCESRKRDHGSKYVRSFDGVFTGAGRTIKQPPIKHEVLNGLLLVPLGCLRG